METTDSVGLPVKGSTTIYEQFENLCAKAQFVRTEQLQSYMDNLVRLRIFGEYNKAETRYIPEGGDRYGTWAPHVDQTNSECIYLTEYGHDFVRACIE